MQMEFKQRTIAQMVESERLMVLTATERYVQFYENAAEAAIFLSVSLKSIDPDPPVEDPIYTLLEDDGLISTVEVQTHRLLSRPNVSEHEVRLVIEVDVRVVQPRIYNQPFLGD